MACTFQQSRAQLKNYRGRSIVGTALLIELCVVSSQAQSQRTSQVVPEFDVAVIKPNKDCGTNRAGQPPIKRIAGRLNMSCMTVEGLILSAYVLFSDGLTYSPEPIPIEGGAPWVRSDYYDLEAQTDQTPSDSLMRGPMLRALLEDRFKLKVRAAVRDIPVYQLTIAKGGPKLQAFRQGSCRPLNVNTVSVPEQVQVPPCQGEFGPRRPRLDRIIFQQHGIDMDAFCRALGIGLDRPILNKTGLPGLFDFYLEFAPSDATPRFLRKGEGIQPDGPGDASGDTVFEALEKAGLKLERAKGPGPYLVIDRVERPSEN